MALQRYLDRIESGLLTVAPTQVAELRGRLRVNVLEAAFEKLCEKYPVLRGRIKQDDGRNLLYVEPEHRASVTVLEGGFDTVERHAKTRWDPARTVATLTYVRGQDPEYVTLRADHSVIDGHSWTKMFSELWTFYTDLVEGRAPVIEGRGVLPDSPYRLLQERWDGDLSGLSEPKKADTPPKIHDRIQRRLRLSEDDTSRLVATARAHGTSMHAVVAGAVLTAQRAQWQVAPSDGPMACLTVVDLRTRIHPRVGPTEAANLLGMHTGQVRVTEDSTPITVGREIKADLNDAIARGDVPLYDLTSFEALRLSTSLHPKLTKASVSNIGVIRPFSHPAELDITDWCRVLPGEPGTPRFPVYAAYTYGGRLNILCFYRVDVFTQHEADRIVQELENQLRKISVG